MRKMENIYRTDVNISETEIQYVFVSLGKRAIVKAIQYTYLHDLSGRKIFNLGFGDYDADADIVFDDVITNNEDHFRIFHTVLATIPNFFLVFPRL